MKKREKIYNRLAELRQKRGLTQAQVAKILHLDITMVCKQEAGDRRISSEQAKVLARLYGCDHMELYLDLDSEPDADAE